MKPLAYMVFVFSYVLIRAGRYKGPKKSFRSNFKDLYFVEKMELFCLLGPRLRRRNFRPWAVDGGARARDEGHEG